MTDEEIKQLCNELDSTWNRYHSYAALARVMTGKEGIDYISSGSSRKVYKVSDTKVLKLAKNVKGSAQNNTEADWALPRYGCVSDWYAVSNNDSIWILSELCHKAKQSDFRTRLGISWQDYINYVRYICSERNPRNYRYYHIERPEKFSEWIEEENLLGYIYGYIGDFNPPCGDLTRISSYGINTAGEIVLVDSGLSESVLSDHYSRKNESVINNGKENKMKPEVKKALYLLENIGYTVTPMNESEQQSVIDTIKSKYDEWNELRNTPEGDDLWDEMVDAYGNDLIDLAVDEYDNLKNGKPVDMTGYLAHADALYPEFFELMQKAGAKAFKINTKEAFEGKAYYLYQVLTEGNVQLHTEAYNSHEPSYAFFTIKD